MAAFQFKNYTFDSEKLIASFYYIGADNTEFCETVEFARPENYVVSQSPHFTTLLNDALILAFHLIGTSYYKTHPTKTVKTPFALTKKQAEFFSAVYQDGLSQFAFENHLTRADLAHFKPASAAQLAEQKFLRKQTLGGATSPQLTDFQPSALILQSGGKDSLLTAKLFKNEPHQFWYLSSSKNHPELLDHLDQPLQHAVRHLDHAALQKSGGLNGHVPVTYIVQSLALIQAILNRQTSVYTSIGQEGAESHAIIKASGRIAKNFKNLAPDDLAVNHQWSKSLAAEQLFQNYVHEFISPELNVYSPLRKYTELKVAELFAKECWPEFGRKFSSCNVANYTQGIDNQALKWCGHCAKCANSYLLFSPFVPRKELDRLFDGHSLFENPELLDDFKGLLGVDDHLKPFECVGEIDELRYAYHHRLADYPALPFTVPESNFNIDRPLSESGF